MAYLQNLVTWIPENRVSLKENNFGKNDDFILKKTGFLLKAISKNISSEDKTIQFGKNACNKLSNIFNYDLNQIDAILFVNQSHKNKLPQLSSLLHKNLELNNKNIFTADIGLGCTGFVQTLQLAKTMIDSNEFENILIVTSDQYPDYLKDDDHNTQLIFGEGSSASIISKYGTGYKLGKYRNHINSNLSDAIKFDEKGFINMNGRKVFDYVMTSALKEIKQIINDNNLKFDKDRNCIFVPHQGSRFIVEMLSRRLGVKGDDLFCSSNVGNLVSTSLPYALEKTLNLNDSNISYLPQNILLAGFGVGLATSCMILNK